MRKLSVFNNVTIDGYFTGLDGDYSWAQSGERDEEFERFVAGNAQGGGVLLLGRITYELMASFWPTPAAKAMMPAVAGPGIAVLGSGSLVAPLATAGLIDEYQMVVVPVAIGAGRTMFAGMSQAAKLRLVESRQFKSGKVFNRYVAA